MLQRGSLQETLVQAGMTTVEGSQDQEAEPEVQEEKGAETEYEGVEAERSGEVPIDMAEVTAEGAGAEIDQEGAGEVVVVTCLAIGKEKTGL